jgi:hypothetical protein
VTGTATADDSDEGREATMPARICIQPCLGIESVESTVGRQACYLAHEELLGPEKSDLGCAPALYAEVQEDIDFIRNDFVVAVESCDKRCANVLVGVKDGEVHATVMVGEVLARAGIDAKALPREHLPLNHPAVRAVADEIARVSEELLSKGGAG